MAFFDNFGKKASQSTTKAIQKAQDYTEISRINSLITEEEEKINSTYYKIGKLYVSTHDEETEKELARLVASISEREKEIKEYRIKIQIIKGIKCCTKCGLESPINAAFCSACGTALPKVEVKSSDYTVKCEHCGTMLKHDMRFCTSCGNPVMEPSATEVRLAQLTEESETANEPIGLSGTDKSDSNVGSVPISITMEDQPNQSLEKTSNLIICPSCGEIIEEGNAYCTECGIKL